MADATYPKLTRTPLIQRSSRISRVEYGRLNLAVNGVRKYSHGNISMAIRKVISGPYFSTTFETINAWEIMATTAWARRTLLMFEMGIPNPVENIREVNNFTVK